jgi:preprotein translocase subunit SecG
MTFLFFVLIILACVLLSAVVLIQNPKGGGLSGTFGGFGNQFMGVKQTTDVLEKGTWLFSGILAVLCIVSVLFFSGNTATPATKAVQNLNTNGSNTAPLNTTPNTTQNPNTVTLPDTNK